MTKIYNGGGEYDISLYSGLKLTLTEEELSELREPNIQANEIEEVLIRVRSLLFKIEDVSEDVSEDFLKDFLKDLAYKLNDLDNYLVNIRCQNRY